MKFWNEYFQTWGNITKTMIAPELNLAVELAMSMAQPGDVILFSPGFPPENATHGTIENRSQDFRRCIREIQKMFQIRKSLKPPPWP